MADSLLTLGYVRYMDDLVIGVRTKAEAWAIHDFVHHHLEHLGLKLKPSATLLSPAHVGFNFLGFRLWPYRIRLDGTRRRRFIRKVIRIKTQQNKPSIHREDLDQYQAQIQGLNAWAAIAHSRGFRASVWARHAPFIDT